MSPTLTSELSEPAESQSATTGMEKSSASSINTEGTETTERPSSRSSTMSPTLTTGCSETAESESATTGMEKSSASSINTEGTKTTEQQSSPSSTMSPTSTTESSEPAESESASPITEAAALSSPTIESSSFGAETTVVSPAATSDGAFVFNGRSNVVFVFGASLYEESIWKRSASLSIFDFVLGDFLDDEFAVAVYTYGYRYRHVTVGGVDNLFDIRNGVFSCSSFAISKSGAMHLREDLFSSLTDDDVFSPGRFSFARIFDNLNECYLNWNCSHCLRNSSQVILIITSGIRINSNMVKLLQQQFHPDTNNVYVLFVNLQTDDYAEKSKLANPPGAVFQIFNLKSQLEINNVARNVTLMIRKRKFFLKKETGA
uniref:VWFA domain-containing protein n=1 Tax=Syphacia muris TaxID=451379 RepID=A0A0N5B0Q2_9BILA